MAEIKIKLAECIKTECRKRKISLTKLATLSGVGKSTLHDWSLGSSPKLDSNTIKNLEKLADFLGVSLIHLIFGNISSEIQADVLFESVFKDGNAKYRLKIEKISE